MLFALGAAVLFALGAVVLFALGAVVAKLLAALLVFLLATVVYSEVDIVCVNEMLFILNYNFRFGSVRNIIVRLKPRC